MFIKKSASNPFVLLVLAVLLWSGNFIVGRAVRYDIDPVSLAFWRWFLAAIIALFLARKCLRHDMREMIKKWKMMLLLSCSGVACFNTLIYIGLQSTVAVNALLMQSVIPALTVLLSVVFFQERLSRHQIIGVVVSFFGVVVIISKGDLSLLAQLQSNSGDSVIFLAVISYSVYSVLLCKRPRVHPLSFVAVSFSLGALMLFPFYLIYGTSFLPPLTVPSFGAISYVAIFPSIVSFLCYNRGVEMVGASKASMFIHLMPVFGSVMAIIFLGESLSAFHGVGIICITCGIFFVTKRGKMC